MGTIVFMEENRLKIQTNLKELCLMKFNLKKKKSYYDYLCFFLSYDGIIYTIFLSTTLNKKHLYIFLKYRQCYLFIISN